ncbi:MAG TPA: hypothetical protein VG452_02815 [Egibacteraceae bacterium]|nr:hypothetical protein [Egibacteraceae bacterium]
MSADPALGFWLRYVEREGGLWEERGDVSLAVLPPSLSSLGLPETILATADPEAAREDGAQLLGPGHPALDHATDDVLERGDAGWTYVPWPGSSRPAISTLQARARDCVALERGRLDVVPPLSACYAPLLRAGALATYTLSPDQRIQERLETWVDARNGLCLGVRVRQVLEGCSRLSEPDSPNPRLRAAPETAVAGAHATLQRWAAARLSGYARHAGSARERERACATAYFAAALDTLTRRRASASGDRQEALDGQVEATRAERARRLQEIDEAYQPGVELRPFRLHLVSVPALRVCARVRLGAVTHDLPLVWLLAPLAGFAPAPCPACGAAEPLVAARAGLGCRGCRR